MKKNLIVLQDGFKECGAASLLSIIRYYHGNVSMSRLTEMTCTNQEGTSFYHIKMAAQEIGLEACGYKVNDVSDLYGIKKPMICQLIHSHYEHFVVIYEIKKHYILLMDPACGERKMSLDEFKNEWTHFVMTFSPARKLASYLETKVLNKIIIDTLKNNKRIVLYIQVLSIIFMFVSLVVAMYFEVILNYFLDNGINTLMIITLIFGIMLMMKCITNFFRNELLIILNQKIDCSILLNTFKKILLLPYSYYKNRSVGEVISRVNDLVYVKSILNKIILTVCLDLIVFISFSIILFLRSYQMFLFLILIIFLYVILFYLFRGRLKRYAEIQQSNTARINSYLVESISGFETIKNMSLEKYVNNRLDSFYLNALSYQFEYENIVNLELFMKDIIYLIGNLLVQFVGFVLVMNSRITVGEVLTFIFLANYVIDPVKNILDLNKEYFYAFNALKRANHLYEIDSDNLEKKSNFKLSGNIFLKNLNFDYRDGDLVLNDVNVFIKENEKVMILGNSGSGKSTILKLLLKYYNIGRDQIYLDDVDINDFSIFDVREQIAMLSQNEVLFQDTIRNNIVMDKSISEKEFFQVTKISCVDEIVKNMFLGYDTLLEENGFNLSGGQRQRIMLARMLLKPSKIILIDEGLNAVDINLERRIFKNIFTYFSDKTIIVVSHRLENMDLFEKVIKLENGKIKDIVSMPRIMVYD